MEQATLDIAHLQSQKTPTEYPTGNPMQKPIARQELPLHGKANLFPYPKEEIERNSN
jgi:hypothetical protein